MKKLTVTEAPAVLILYREFHGLVVAWWHSSVAGLVVTLEVQARSQELWI